MRKRLPRFPPVAIMAACLLSSFVTGCSTKPSEPAMEDLGPEQSTVEARRDDVRDPSSVTGADRRIVGPGNWRRARPEPSRAPLELTDAQRATIRKLDALGYATGSRHGQAGGITIHTPERVHDGLNLYTSGHGAEAILMDMEGKVVHRWHRDFAEAFPEYPPDRPRNTGMQWWYWVHLFENGEILAMFSGVGLAKLNARSEVLWARPNRAHHDMAVADSGDIYVLTHAASLIPRVHETEPILEDFIAVLTPDGQTTRSFSLLEAFEGTPFEDAWRNDKEHGDVFHSNTLVLLDGSASDRIPAFKKGNLLFSMAFPNLLAVLDPGSGKIVWVLKGEFKIQHDCQLTEKKTLLLFDNRGIPNVSRALELDPVTGKTVWEYRGDGKNPRMWSNTMGAVQRLPNGNTLITESDGGRVIEVTGGGEIVWEFRTPHRAGEKNEFIATIGRMRRLPSDYPLGWVPR